MYIERRLSGTTPTMWADNFLGRATPWHRLFMLRMQRDPRWLRIRGRVRAGGRVLDAGCGAGEWVEFLHGQGFDAQGLDYAPELVRALERARPSMRWMQGPIQSVPVSDGHFDAVISWGVIEHDEAGPQAALREFHRIVRPGGWIFVTVPLDTPTQRESSQRQFAAERDRGDFFQFFFTPDELRGEVERAGFEVDLVEPCSSHYAVLHPDLYLRVVHARRAVQLLATPLLNLYARARPDAHNMILAVARRP